MMTSLPIEKNARLRRYETDIQGISVDIYLPHYSNLAIPPEELMKESRIIEGFRVPKPEILLALKQQAEIEYAKRVDRTYLKRLREIVVQAKDEFKYLGFGDLREIGKKRKELLRRIDGVNLPER